MKPRKWKMWALMPKDEEMKSFDAYLSRRHAQFVKAPYEKVIAVEVLELKPRRRAGR